MSTGNPTVTVNLRAEDENLSSSLGQVEGKLNSFAVNMASMAVVAGAVFEGIKKVSGAVADLIEISNVQESAMRRTVALYEASGRGGEEAAQKLFDYASALQKVSTFGDEATIAASKYLVIMQNLSEEALPRATQVSADLAAAMGEDISAAMQKVARAIEDPEQGMRALRSAGVQLSDEQQDLIKSLSALGETARAQDEIFSALEKRFSGAAQAELDTYAGKIKYLQNAWGDTKEVMGDVVKDGLTPLVETLIENQDILENLGEMIRAWGPAFEAAGGGIAILVEKLSDLYDTLSSIPGADVLKYWEGGAFQALDSLGGGDMKREERARGRDLDKQLRESNRAQAEEDRKRRHAENEGIVAESNARKKAMEDATKSWDEHYRKREAYEAKLASRADALRKSLQTPLEDLAGKWKEIAKLQRDGFIDAETYSRAIAKYQEEFINKGGLLGDIEKSNERIASLRHRMEQRPKDTGFQARFEGIESLSQRIQAAAVSRTPVDTEQAKTRAELIKEHKEAMEIRRLQLEELRRRRDVTARFTR